MFLYLLENFVTVLVAEAAFNRGNNRYQNFYSSVGTKPFNFLVS